MLRGSWPRRGGADLDDERRHRGAGRRDPRPGRPGPARSAAVGRRGLGRCRRAGPAGHRAPADLRVRRSRLLRTGEADSREGFVAATGVDLKSSTSRRSSWPPCRVTTRSRSGRSSGGSSSGPRAGGERDRRRPGTGGSGRAPGGLRSQRGPVPGPGELYPTWSSRAAAPARPTSSPTTTWRPPRGPGLRADRAAAHAVQDEVREVGVELGLPPESSGGSRSPAPACHPDRREVTAERCASGRGRRHRAGGAHQAAWIARSGSARSSCSPTSGRSGPGRRRSYGYPVVLRPSPARMR